MKRIIGWLKSILTRRPDSAVDDPADDSTDDNTADAPSEAEVADQEDVPTPPDLEALDLPDTDKLTRILGPSHGSAWSYGRLAGSPGTDPGQPPTRQLTRYGEVGGIGRTGRRYAIIGRDVRRALSPGFHNRLLARSGVEGAVFLDVSLEIFLNGLLRGSSARDESRPT